MLNITSERYIKVEIDSQTKVIGTIQLILNTDLNAHAKLSVIPNHELSLLLNQALTDLIDDVLPKIELLTQKYTREEYSE